MAGVVSFIREGFRELGRKFGRMKLRRELAKADRERRQALTALGRKAWEERAGLSAFPEIASEIGRLEGRAGELSAAAERLGTEKAGLEARRKAEADRLDGDRRAVEEKKKPVEAKLREAERRRGELENRLKRIDARRSEIQGEMAALERQPQAEGAAAGSAREKADALRAEQESLAGEAPRLRSETEGLGAEIGPLAEEVQRYAGEIARVEAEKKAVLSQIDAELSRVRNELGAATKESAAVGKDQAERFERLGLGIYERGSSEPGLAEAAGQVSAIDRDRAGTQSRIDSSLAETAAMPRGTMLKFYSATILVPAVLVGLLYGMNAGLSWWKHRTQTATMIATVNPYLSHPLKKHPAYALADRIWEAHNEKAAARAVHDLFRAIGLGVYKTDGTPVLPGAERGKDDFFVYDYQVGVLARAMVRRNEIPLRRYAGTIKEGFRLNLGGADVPFSLRYLAQGMRLRFQRASASPDDPRSFLPLVVDGLARRHERPTSLSRYGLDPPGEIMLDPVQAFLISLDVFSRAGTSENAAVRRAWLAQVPGPVLFWFMPAVPCVAPACASIAGNAKAVGGWGHFLEALGTGLGAEGIAVVSAQPPAGTVERKEGA